MHHIKKTAAALLLVTACGLTAKQVVNAVFNVEQAACLADASAAQDLTGEPQVIATALMTACGFAQPLFQDVLNYVNSLSAVKAAKAAKAAKH